MLSRDYHCFHHIAGLETLNASLLLGAGAREAVLIHAAHLAALAPGGFNAKYLYRWVKADLRATFTHTGRINPMRFRVILRDTVKLVRPPVPVSTGRPDAFTRSYKYQRVVFTAAASLSGCLTCAWMCGNPHSSGVCVPFNWVQGAQAMAKLLTRLDPPRCLGMMCSACRGTSPTPQ